MGEMLFEASKFKDLEEILKKLLKYKRDSLIAHFAERLSYCISKRIIDLDFSTQVYFDFKNYEAILFSVFYFKSDERFRHPESLKSIPDFDNYFHLFEREHISIPVCLHNFPSYDWDLEFRLRSPLSDLQDAFSNISVEQSKYTKASYAEKLEIITKEVLKKRDKLIKAIDAYKSYFSIRLPHKKTEISEKIEFIKFMLNKLEYRVISKFSYADLNEFFISIGKKLVFDNSEFRDRYGDWFYFSKFESTEKLLDSRDAFLAEFEKNKRALVYFDLGTFYSGFWILLEKFFEYIGELENDELFRSTKGKLFEEYIMQFLLCYKMPVKKLILVSRKGKLTKRYIEMKKQIANIHEKIVLEYLVDEEDLPFEDFIFYEYDFIFSFQSMLYLIEVKGQKFVNEYQNIVHALKKISEWKKLMNEKANLIQKLLPKLKNVDMLFEKIDKVKWIIVKDGIYDKENVMFYLDFVNHIASLNIPYFLPTEVQKDHHSSVKCYPEYVREAVFKWRLMNAPKKWQFWVVMGHELMMQNRLDEAEFYFLNALKINLEEEDSMYNLACIYALKGYNDKAYFYLSKAIELNEELRKVAKKDKDFASLRKEKQFQKIIFK